MTPRKIMTSGCLGGSLMSCPSLIWFLGRGWGSSDPRFPLMFLLVLLHTTPFPVYPYQLCYAMYCSWPFSSCFTNSPPIPSDCTGKAPRGQAHVMSACVWRRSSIVILSWQSIIIHRQRDEVSPVTRPTSVVGTGSSPPMVICFSCRSSLLA